MSLESKKTEAPLWEPPVYVNLGIKQFDISNIPSGKVLDSVSRYNDVTKWYNDLDEKKIKAQKQYMSKLIDIALYIIRPYFSLHNLKKWIVTRFFLTKRWILKNSNKNQLDEFLDAAFEPILGKKKEKTELTTVIEKVMMDKRIMDLIVEDVKSSLHKES